MKNLIAVFIAVSLMFVGVVFASVELAPPYTTIDGDEKYIEMMGEGQFRICDFAPYGNYQVDGSGEVVDPAESEHWLYCKTYGVGDVAEVSIHRGV